MLNYLNINSAGLEGERGWNIITIVWQQQQNGVLVYKKKYIIFREKYRFAVQNNRLKKNKK